MMQNIKLRSLASAVLIGVLIFITLFAAFSIGAVDISFSETWTCLTSNCHSSINQLILWELRWPRILLAFWAGGALAISGALLQNATGNPLAEPYLFGLVSGASLGAIIFNMFFVASGGLGLPISAFIGALGALMLVIFVYRTRANSKPEHLILIGVSVSFMLAALSQYLLFATEPLAANRIVFWLMGSVANSGYTPIIYIMPLTGLVIVLTIIFRRQIDALMLGDETAISLGVPADKLRIMLLIAAAGLTAVVVAFCGGIGFVGLMIPHIIRRFGVIKTGPLVAFSGLVGGVFLVWVDLFARTSMAGHELPLGIVTSAIGSIFFLTLLNEKQK
jgi:iron complex transport system permease protein